MPRATTQKFTDPVELEQAKPDVLTWTTREMRMWIRAITNELNRWAEETPEDDKDPLVIQLWHKTQGALGDVREDLKLPMRLTYKRKPELVYQVRKLRELRNFNVFMDNEKQREREEKARKAFNRNNQINLSEEEYSNLVDVFGSSPDYFRTFGYEDFVDMAAEQMKKGMSAQEFINITSDVMAQWKKRDEGYSTEEALDMLAERLREWEYKDD